MRSTAMREKKTKSKEEIPKPEDQTHTSPESKHELTYSLPETQIVLKDGKPTIVENIIALPSFSDKVSSLQPAEKKPYKLNSMSFRSRSHTAKWTEQDTEKFYKVLKSFE